jgi:hypothetical protein
MAVRAGMTFEDARRFPSEAALVRVVGLIADTELANRSAAERQEPETPAADPMDALPELDPEDYDPKVIEMFDAMKGVLQNQNETIAGFQNAQDAVVQAGQAAADREVTQWFDKSINDLGQEEALGTGSSGDQTPGSSQLAKRDAIAGQCAVLLAGYGASGQPTPSREEVFRMSARLVLADEFQALQEKELSAGLAKQAGNHIHRAGGKKTKSTQDPAAEIAAMIDAKYPPQG